MDEKESKRLGYNRFMIEDVQRVGTTRLLAANIKEKRIRKRLRDMRTKKLSHVMLHAMNVANATGNPSKEEVNLGKDTPWRRKVKSMFAELY